MQLRFGHKDVEVFTKYRGSKEGFKKMRLKDFMEGENLPEFDHSIAWRKGGAKPERRKLNFGWEGTLPSLKRTEDPAMGKKKTLT